MNSTGGTHVNTEIVQLPNEADWALQAGIPDGAVNATGLLADDLEEYAGGLTEIQTLILACVATVIPLFLGLLLVLGVRMVWKKYKNHNTNDGYDNDGLRREDSCDAVKSSSFMQSVEELKTSESQYSVLMPDDAGAPAGTVGACCYAVADGKMPQPPPPLLYHSPPNNRFGDTNKTNLNGSIITLTMKNNHLIVETEERVPGVCMAEAAIAEGSEKSYEYDDDEFDMEAEMLRREFREASLLANGGGGGCCSRGPVAAVLEPSSQTQVDLTADRRPTAAAAPIQLQPAAGDHHSSGGSSSIDSRVAEMAYAYGNQSEYAAVDVVSKHCGKGGKSMTSTAAASANNNNNNNNNINNINNINNNNNNNNNNNDDEYLVEQRLLGNGTDGTGSLGSVTSSTGATDGGSPPQPLPDENNRSPESRVAAVASSAAQ